MKIALVLWLFAGVVLLNGCQNSDRGGSASPTPPALPSPVVKAGKCQLADTVSAARCKREGGQRVCRLTAFDSSSGPTVFPYKLKVPAHGPNAQVTIIWELLGDDEEFDASKGDGPVQLLSDARFKNAWPAAAPDAAASAAKGKYFRIEFDNQASTGTGGIAYDLQFRSAGGREAKCDPIINNESG